MLSNICSLTYVSVYELLHMQLYEYCCRCAISLSITLDFWLILFLACDASFLMCSLLSWVLLQVAKGCTHLTPHVLEPLIQLPWLTASITCLLLTELSYLPPWDIALKALPYDPLLGLLHQIVWGLIGTSYRGDPLDILVGPTLSTFRSLDGGLDDKLCPLI